MSAYKDKDGVYRYRCVVRIPATGDRIRISGTPHPINNKTAATHAEHQHAAETLRLGYDPHKKEREEKRKLTFAEFWEQNYWREQVVGGNIKPSTQIEKNRVYNSLFKPEFGDLPIDSINSQHIAQFRAKLLKKGTAPSTINQYMNMLSPCLTYAEDSGIIVKKPKITWLKTEKAEIEAFTFDEYRLIINAAIGISHTLYLFILLCGEAGLREGEVKALKWEDIDFQGRSMTIRHQTLYGKTTTPKGNTIRTIPLTNTLYEALNNTLNKRGYVVQVDGKQITDNQATWFCRKVYVAAGLRKVEEQYSSSHILRHTFATHSAYFGVNAWALQSWLGHKNLTQTMDYVNYVGHHSRTIPDRITQVGQGLEGDKKVLAMLSARSLPDIAVLTASNPA